MNNSLESVIQGVSHIEELCPGLTFQWLFNGYAIGMYAEHSSHKLVDMWANKIIEISQTWPQNRPFFILNDFSGKDCSVTPYNQQKSRELLNMFPELKTYNALVVKQNLTMQLTRLFIRTIPGNRLVHLTFSREDAIVWLKKQIDIYREAQV